MSRTKRKAGVWMGILAAILAGTAARAPGACAQQVVDRIVARVEGDILLRSDLRELGASQRLFGGPVEPESKRLDELIDQWIIEHEAEAAQFAQPSQEDVDSALQQAEKSLGGEQEFKAKMKEEGLSLATVRRILGREIFFSRYLDYKFRHAAQVDAAAEEKYYKDEFVPKMTARGEVVPPIDSVRDQIHELLVQKEITARAEQWLAESRTRLKIEVMAPMDGTPGTPPKGGLPE
ncbi:MAG TPA: hypothetical protein VGZ48_00720 [Candidatus Acidoferrales bacterium]|jgi:hypothetical protein|nr:hypothetical protein [Candidatus Acidoferrales bacterium]